MWFLGNASTPAIRAAMHAGELGMIITPAEGRPPLDGVVFGADNGCYGKGYPGDRRWLSWLAQWTPHADRCLWATAPDVVGDARATLERSRPYLPRIRELALPAALVAQEGAENLALPWDEFDVLFIGGHITAWKLGPAAADLVAEAHHRGKPVHFGRVNSHKRWRYANRLGCASVDGTCLTFAPDTNLARVRHWIASDNADPTPPLPSVRAGQERTVALSIVPVTFRQAREFIRVHHRHQGPPQAIKFALGVATADHTLVGVAVVGWPLSRHLDDNGTLEVTCCCTDGTRNANSMLYAAAWRVTKALGYRRLVTYTEGGEPGSRLRAAGFRPVTDRRADGGGNRPSRPHAAAGHTVVRTRWELSREQTTRGVRTVQSRPVKHQPLPNRPAPGTARQRVGRPFASAMNGEAVPSKPTDHNGQTK